MVQTANPTYMTLGMNVGGIGPTTLQEWSRQQNLIARQDREHELKMRELEYMAAQQALGIPMGAQPGRTTMPGAPGAPGAGGTSAAAQQFLNQWQQYLNQAGGVYNQALGAFQSGQSYLQNAQQAAQSLGGQASSILQQYGQMQQEMRPLQEALTGAAMEDIGTRQQFIGQLQALATPDYEGAAGRAIADVAGQAELMRGAEARRMQALGIDPTSGRGMAASRTMAGQESLGRALAATGARMGEKQRVAGLTTAGLTLIDPTRAAGTALDIRRGGTELLSIASGLQTAGVQAQSQLAGQAGALATGMAGVGTQMAQTLAAPYGEMAGLYAGLGYEQGGMGSLPVPGGGGGAGAPGALPPGAVSITPQGQPLYQHAGMAGLFTNPDPGMGRGVVAPTPAISYGGAAGRTAGVGRPQYQAGAGAPGYSLTGSVPYTTSTGGALPPTRQARGLGSAAPVNYMNYGAGGAVSPVGGYSPAMFAGF